MGGDRRRLLHQSVEQFPPRTGGPSVEAERKLIKIAIQMLQANSPLIRAKPPAVEQRGAGCLLREPLHSLFSGRILRRAAQRPTWRRSFFLYAVSVGLFVTKRDLYLAACPGSRRDRIEEHATRLQPIFSSHRAMVSIVFSRPNSE